MILSEPKQLPEFIETYYDSLPCTALVMSGYSDDSNTLDISCNEILRIESLHTIPVVLATSMDDDPLPPIPLHTIPVVLATSMDDDPLPPIPLITEQMLFSLLYDPNDNRVEAMKGFVFGDVSSLLSAVQPPKVVCVLEDWNGDLVRVSRGEILVINKNCLNRSNANSSGLATFSISNMIEKFLPKACTRNFSTDPTLIQMSLQNIVAYIKNPFPCKVYTQKPLHHANSKVIKLVDSNVIQKVNFATYDLSCGKFVPSLIQLTLNQTAIELALIEDPQTLQPLVVQPEMQQECAIYSDIDADFKSSGPGDTLPPLPPKDTKTPPRATARKTGCQPMPIAEAPNEITSVQQCPLPPCKPMIVAGKKAKSLPKAFPDLDTCGDVLPMHQTGKKATLHEVQEDSQRYVRSTDASRRYTSIEQFNPSIETEKTSIKMKETKTSHKSKAGAGPKRWYSFVSIGRKAGNTPIPGYLTVSKPLSLKRFISLYSSRFPVSIHVCTNASLVSASEYLDAIAIENNQVVLAEDSTRKQVDIPLVSTEKFSLLHCPAEADPLLGSTFNSVSDLLRLVNVPKVICVTRSWSNEVAENEILIIQSILLTDDQKRGFLSFSTSSQSEKFISRSCRAYFSTAATLLGLPMLQLVQHVPDFLPCRVCRVRCNGEMQKCCPNDVITLKEVLFAPVLECVPICQRERSIPTSVHIPISLCGVDVVVLKKVNEESTLVTKINVCQYCFLFI